MTTPKNSKNGAGSTRSAAAPRAAGTKPPRAVETAAVEPDETLNPDGGEDFGEVDPASLVTAFGKALVGSRSLLRAGRELSLEAAKIAVGRSEIEPAKGDRRFTDPAWAEHPAYRRVKQLYLAFSDTVDGVVESANVEWQTKERARFAAGIVTSTLAPTNVLPGNPAALKRAWDTAGLSLVRGTRNWVGDLRHNGGMPRQVDASGYVVGENTAVSPGAVVFRNEVCELLQYSPSTPTVRSRPVVIIPPMINKYYFLDLAPGRSLVEHAVSRGLTVFMVSWKNPSKDQGEWNLDIYARAVLDAIDAAREVTGSEDVVTLGLCAGGILTATVLSYLAATGDTRVHASSFSVTLLDWGLPAPMGAFNTGGVLGLARRRSRRGGVLDARSLGSVFTWLRPNDLVWNYWVNNYLMGNKPPAFDILAWNADGTNMPGALHGQFLDIFAGNTLTRPGEVVVLGHGVDLPSVKTDSYVVGGLSDHLTPWQGCYRSTQLLGGHATFVLSPTGHIQTPVSPPGPKAHYFTGPEPGPSAEAWRAAAERQEGTWWSHWADWVTERAGDSRSAPKSLGSARHPVLGDAPGSYVHERA